MIIKAQIRAGYRDMCEYLLEQGENEATRLVYISDPHARNLDDAFLNMAAIDCNGRAKKPIFHFTINPDIRDRRLTDGEVLEISRNLMKKCSLVLGEHQFVIVEHILNGRQHFHIAANRISLTTGLVALMGLFYAKCQFCGREMERRLGLRSPFSANEREELNASALGWSINQIDQTLYEAFKRSRNSKEFRDLAAKYGFTILRGRPNRKGEPTLHAQDIKGGYYRLTASFMRSDMKFRKKHLIEKLGSEIGLLPQYKPQVKSGGFRFSSFKSNRSHSRQTEVTESNKLNPKKNAHLRKPDHQDHSDGDNVRKRKSGDTSKGDGSGGGMSSINSALKSEPKSKAPPPMIMPDKEPGPNNGPERRRKKMWVAVERRQQR